MLGPPGLLLQFPCIAKSLLSSPSTQRSSGTAAAHLYDVLSYSGFDYYFCVQGKQKNRDGTHSPRYLSSTQATTELLAYQRSQLDLGRLSFPGTLILGRQYVLLIRFFSRVVLGTIDLLIVLPCAFQFITSRLNPSFIHTAKPRAGLYHTAASLFTFYIVVFKFYYLLRFYSSFESWWFDSFVFIFTSGQRHCTR